MDFILNMIKLDFKDVRTFIEGHNHINYCEALILPDGKIANIVTSHQNCLLKLYMQKFDYTYQEAYDATLPYISDFNEHLHGELNVVSVRYEMLEYEGGLTDKQAETVALLQTSGTISSKVGHLIHEYRRR